MIELELWNNMAYLYDGTKQLAAFYFGHFRIEPGYINFYRDYLKKSTYFQEYPKNATTVGYLSLKNICKIVYKGDLA